MNSIPTPYYIVYEERLRKNLTLIQKISNEANVKIIMAFKANALWKTFPIMKEYVKASTASSLNEMQLALDYLCDEVHSYCPVYTDLSFPKFLEGSSHITFNSLAQFNKYYPQIEAHNKRQQELAAKGDIPTPRLVSAGLRINPQCSVIETDIYNPCLPGSRFGVEKDALPKKLPTGLEGLHFHALCESTSYDLEKVLEALEEQFSEQLHQAKWLNMGGGHLMTREGYDIDHLIGLLKRFNAKYPNLQLIMEPGSAFTWRTGDLITSVMDVVDKGEIKTAIIDASFACHMPDCLEMPYKPIISEALPEGETSANCYRLGGNSCLSGDYVGDWYFQEPLKPGDRLTLEDMNHYTTVKTNMFNGIQHPAIYLQLMDGSAPKLLREYTYEDYKSRMD